MTKEEFKKLFLSNVRQALASAEKILARTLSPEFEIELHGGDVPGQIVPTNQAVDIMYLREDLFYRIIDIGVRAVRNDQATVFVRISPQAPSDFEHTWNSPKGNGPFKVVEPMNIKLDN